MGKWWVCSRCVGGSCSGQSLMVCAKELVPIKDFACPGKRVTKKVADLPSQNFWLSGNYLNYYYHPVRAPPRDKQSCSLSSIDNTSLLIHSCSILSLNISKMRCFAYSLSQCDSEL